MSRSHQLPTPRPSLSPSASSAFSPAQSLDEIPSSGSIQSALAQFGTDERIAFLQAQLEATQLELKTANAEKDLYRQRFQNETRTSGRLTRGLDDARRLHNLQQIELEESRERIKELEKEKARMERGDEKVIQDLRRVVVERSIQVQEAYEKAEIMEREAQKARKETEVKQRDLHLVMETSLSTIKALVKQVHDLRAESAHEHAIDESFASGPSCPIVIAETPTIPTRPALKAARNKGKTIRASPLTVFKRMGHGISQSHTRPETSTPSSSTKKVFDQLRPKLQGLFANKRPGFTVPRVERQ